MKKINLVIALLLVAVFGLKAQNTVFDKPLTLSVNAGSNWATLRYSEIEDIKSNLAFNAGVGADFNISEYVGIVTGLNFMMNRSSEPMYASGGKPSGFDLCIHTSYIDLPFMLSLRYRVAENVRFDLNLGGYAAYGVWGKNKIKNTDDGGYAGTLADTFNKSGFKKFDAGLAFGARAHYSHIYLDAKYELGLTDISQLPIYKIKRTVFSLGLGYSF